MMQLVGLLVWLLADGQIPPGPASQAAASTVSMKAARPDALFVGLGLDRLSDSGDGGSVNVDWVRPLQTRHLLTLGLAHHRLADSDWSYAKVGGVLAASGRTHVAAEVKLGFGSDDGDSFDYRIAKLETMVQVLPRGRLVVSLEDQYVAVDSVRGNLVGAGFSTTIGKGLNLELGHRLSTSGNVDTSLSTGRLVITRSRFGLLVGTSLGEQRPELASLFTVTSGSDDYREVFAGLNFPLREHRLALTLSSLRFADTTRYSLITSLRLDGLLTRGGGDE